MIRVLYLIDALETPRAGTESQLLAILERLDRRRFEPSLAVLRRSSWLDGAALPYPVDALGLSSWTSPHFPRARRRFIALCRERRVDVVHSFFRESNLLGPLWAGAAKVPVVVGSRRNIGYELRLVDRLFRRPAARRITHVVANSEAAAQHALRQEGLRPEQITVIPNGLDLARFAPSANGETAAIRSGWGFPPDVVVVGCLANLRPVKNLDFLVESASTLVPRFPRARFVILGEGPERARLEARVRALGLEGRVILPGPSTNVPRDLAALDIGVLVSSSESSPNAVIEYLAAGKPVVASDVGGTRELLDSEDLGEVFPSGDHDRFRALLAGLLVDEGRRARMGKGARDAASSRFDWNAVLPRLETLYQTLLDSQARRRL